METITQSNTGQTYSCLLCKQCNGTY